MNTQEVLSALKIAYPVKGYKAEEAAELAPRIVGVTMLTPERFMIVLFDTTVYAAAQEIISSSNAQLEIGTLDHWSIVALGTPPSEIDTFDKLKDHIKPWFRPLSGELDLGWYDKAKPIDLKLVPVVLGSQPTPDTGLFPVNKDARVPSRLSSMLDWIPFLPRR